MLNFGSDILVNNTSRIGDFGIEQLQGDRTDIQSFSAQVSYMFFHDLSLDLLLTLRNESSELNNDLITSYWGFGLRYNIENRTIDY